MAAPLNNQNHLKHGMGKTRLYRIWKSMRQRCNNPKCINYHNYGGKGVTVCNEWDDFMQFKNWAMKTGYKDNLTIDRIKSSGNYCPDNCRWVTYKVQNNNRDNNKMIEYNGEMHTISEWSDIVGIKMQTLWMRLKNGWNIEKALTTPLRKNQFC